MSKTAPYTVLLLYPNYWGEAEIYFAHVNATTVQSAVRKALTEAAAACSNHELKKADFTLLAVFAGHINDLKE